MRITDSFSCNGKDSTTSVITVTVKSTEACSYSPIPPQPNTPVVFTNASGNANRYTWLFADNDSLVTSNTNPVTHTYNSAGSFTACLLANNTNGCAPDTACRIIKASVTPLADVPNAFSPNGDGVNDKIFVRGYGITRMKWRIYNRWGIMVFESSTITDGWDGRYKCVLQPADIYTYGLEIEFSSGEKLSKTGDITLLK